MDPYYEKAYGRKKEFLDSDPIEIVLRSRKIIVISQGKPTC